MSALRWLEAGATGSYGTVVEPCAMPQKFPNPTVAIGRYLMGETLIEAYWKSVLMPGQGIFIGERWLRRPPQGGRIERVPTDAEPASIVARWRAGPVVARGAVCDFIARSST
jgi:hypothetical protein